MKIISISEHREIGDSLQRLRHELMETRGKVPQSQAKPFKALTAAIEKIDLARCLLDTQLINHNFEQVEELELTKVYYGRDNTASEGTDVAPE